MLTKVINRNLKNVEKNIQLLKDKNFIDLIAKTSKEIAKTLKNKKKILFCGNGGSAADSQHLSAELLGRYLKNRRAYSAVDLTSNSATLTAISNDISFSKIFERQIEAIGKKNDILFAITTSGKSKNIINAIKISKKLGLKTILLTSNKAKKLKKFVNIYIPCPGSRVDRIQETQKIVGHIICELVEEILS